VKSDPQRVVAMLAVLLLHVGLVSVVAVALHYHRATAEPDQAITLVLLALPPGAAAQQRGPGEAPFTPAPATAITLPPLAPPPGGAVDWDAEARKAAARTAEPQKRPFGHNPASEAPQPAGTPAMVVHHAGEQYREADGSSIVFVNDRCFVATDAPPPGTPDLIARARPTRTVCRGDPGWSRADLFRDLPAYERYHRAQPGKR
jgi:hypothetical protein